MQLKPVLRILPAVLCLGLVVVVATVLVSEKNNAKGKATDLNTTAESLNMLDAGYRMVQFTRLAVNIR